MIGVSLALNLPRIAGRSPATRTTSRSRRADAALARAPRSSSSRRRRLRQRMLERLPRELTAAAVYGGTPSVAHTEALLRGTVFKGVPARRAARRDRDRDPADDAVDAARTAEPGHRRLPRARPRAAALAERAARRERRHGDPACTRLPAPLPAPDADAVPRALLRPRTARDRRRWRGRDAAAATSARSPTTAPADACHPLQPFLEWSACDAVANRLGAVLVAGCRDAQAARQLGLRARCTASARRSRWPAAAARSGSASCSRRRTSRS